MGDTHRHSLLQLGVLVEHLFDVSRVDVKAAGDDHILLAVHDAKVAVLVHAGDIARVQPAILEDVGRLLRHVPVAFHHLGSLDAQLASLPLGHDDRVILQVDQLALGIGPGQPYRPDAVLPVDRVRVGHRRGLGEAVTLDQPAAGQILEVGLHFFGQASTPADAGLDGTQIVLADVRIVVDGHIHSGHAGKERGLVLLDIGQDELEIAGVGDQDECSCRIDAVVHAGGHGIAMAQRQSGNGDLAGRVAVEPHLTLHGVDQQIAMGQLCPLGHARGAPCVKQAGRIIHAHPDGRGHLWGLFEKIAEPDGIHLFGEIDIVPLRFLFEQREQPLEHGREIVLDVGHDHILDRRLVTDLLQGRVKAAQHDGESGTRIV